MAQLDGVVSVGIDASVGPICQSHSGIDCLGEAFPLCVVGQAGLAHDLFRVAELGPDLEDVVAVVEVEDDVCPVFDSETNRLVVDE